LLDRPRRALIVPGGVYDGNGFRNQCEHWWRKHFLEPVSRPEIRKNFRITLCFLAMKDAKQIFITPL
jgi:hypothetical protein